MAYCRQAGEKAMARSAYREAVAYFEQTLRPSASAGDARHPGAGPRLRLALERPLRTLGEYGRCLALLGEAEALARVLADRARLGRVLARMGQDTQDYG